MGPNLGSPGGRYGVVAISDELRVLGGGRQLNTASSPTAWKQRAWYWVGKACAHRFVHSKAFASKD
jgi:hypothetical protein